jgi:hypothetical protein
MPDPVAAYYQCLRSGDWQTFASVCDDGPTADEVRAAVNSWKDYAERPRVTLKAGEFVGVQSEFAGVTHAGMTVELEALTVFELRGKRLRHVTSWHQPAETERHLEIPAVATALAYFDAANAGDWSRMAGLWSADGEMIAVGGPPRRGRESVVEAYRRFLSLFPTYRDEVDRIVLCGRSLTVSGRFVAVTRNGEDANIRWIDQIDLTDDRGRVDRLTHWHDRTRMPSLTMKPRVQQD